MKNIPFTKILLQVDDGFDLSGTGLAVEYHIFTKKIVWNKKNNAEFIKKSKNIFTAIGFGTAGGSFFIFDYLSEHGMKSTAEQRLEIIDYYIIIPIILSLLCIIIIEYIKT